MSTTVQGGGEATRVLRVIARLNIGGPARHAVVLNAGLEREGWRTLLAFGSVDESEASFEDLAETKHLRTLKIQQMGRRIKPWDDLSAFLRLYGLMRRERPDVLHTHTAKAGALGRSAALLYNLTQRRHHRCLVVHTFHGHVFAGYFGTVGSRLVRWTEQALSLVTDRVVAISPRQRDDLVDQFKIASPKKVHVVPLGLELDGFSTLKRDSAVNAAAKERFGFALEDIVLGFVGRFARIKNLEMLISAFQRLSRDYPEVRLMLVGDGELRQSLDSLVDSLGLRRRVLFTGWQRDLLTVYAAMDAVVMSSLNEGTPVAIVEAMAAALPVVATNVGGVADLIDDGLDGLLVRSGDIEALHKSMAIVAANPALRLELGNAARNKIRKRFAPERLVADISALYRDGLAEKRGQF